MRGTHKLSPCGAGLLPSSSMEALPYARMGGSGTSGAISAVGYMQPLPQADEIDGTVAGAA